MKKALLIATTLFLIVSGSAFAQNVGVTDKSGGITPATTLQVHKNASTGNVVQITTGNTGETSSDGLVIKRDASSFGIVSQENDTINIGGSTDPGSHTSFEKDGTMVFKGGATVWDDIMVYPDATGRGSSNPPVWEIFKTNGSGSQGVWLYWFSAS